MLMTLPDTPYSFTVTPALQYGDAPEMPPWFAPLHLDLFCPSPLPSIPAPAVIYLHGGAWSEGERSTGLYPWLSPLLATHGFVTVNVTYRLSPIAPFPAQIYDVKAAVRWLRANAERYHINSEHIGVWGDSAGGQLAALLGLTGDVSALEGNCGSPTYSSRVQAVVTRSAPYNFLSTGGSMINDAPSPITQLFGGNVSEKADLMSLASPISHVNSDAPPFQIVHGMLDETIPFDQATRFVETLKAADVEVDFHPIQNVYHNLRPEEYAPWTDDPWEEMGWKALAFFQKHLCQ